MNGAAHQVSIPRPPRMPHDWIALLTYQAPQSKLQARRCAENALLAAGVALDGATQADEL